MRFTPHGTEVFHRLDTFCIPDSGLVPPYALFQVEPRGGELRLHHYDYRARPSLLQAPATFRRLTSLPEECGILGLGARTEPRQIYQLIVRAFDRHYASFDARQMDWAAHKARFAERANALETDEQLFDLLSEMVKPLRDGHVNVTWSGRTFSAASPKLRARLRDAWATSGTTLTEGAFVSTWQRTVQESVYPLLDPGTRRSGANGALEWGTIADTIGYVRINRFSGFTAANAERPVQFDSLDAALSRLKRDLAASAMFIVDVALNGGGSDPAAQLVASHFADVRRPLLRYEVDRAAPNTIYVEPVGRGERRPVLLLTSEVTASAAEIFVLMMRAFPHVTHIGERTRGDLSSMLPKPFPNAFRVTLPYQRVFDDVGTSFEAVGIPPERSIVLFPEGDLTGGFAAALARLTRAGPR
ncbi:MAG: S41 family peptidase [Gemmatimonadaceae bacterium]|nr:S41 family peptidase [Gemmatimonadaceae bacterium]